MTAPPPSTSFEEELAQAARLCRKSKLAVQQCSARLRLGKALDAEACLPLVEEIAESVFRNPGALVSLARLKTTDDYSYMHSVAVCALMVALARAARAWTRPPAARPAWPGCCTTWARR